MHNNIPFRCQNMQALSISVAFHWHFHTEFEKKHALIHTTTFITLANLFSGFEIPISQTYTLKKHKTKKYNSSVKGKSKVWSVKKNKINVSIFMYTHILDIQSLYPMALVYHTQNILVAATDGFTI